MKKNEKERAEKLINDLRQSSARVLSSLRTAHDVISYMYSITGSLYRYPINRASEEIEQICEDLHESRKSIRKAIELIGDTQDEVGELPCISEITDEQEGIN